MEVKDALNIVKNACAAFQGNLKDHSAIQESLMIIESKLNESQEKEKKK